MEKLTRGGFFNFLETRNCYSDEQKLCIEDTVANLLSNDTSQSKPGMLLGRIQSGKTRTFIGVIGLALDNGYDTSIVLTKGTRALSQQTFQRLSSEFHDLLITDKVQVFDILNFPNNLTKYELCQKLIVVAKKEVNNLERLEKALFSTYPVLGNRKTLIVDDEADFASIGFEKTKTQGIKIKAIAGRIDNLRKKLADCSLLQVTATPYSLYLQPDELAIKQQETEQFFKPIRPAFTVLVPTYPEYVGEDFYFNNSQNENNVASYIYQPIAAEELKVLKESNEQEFVPEQALTSVTIESLRNAVINFIVGGTIRRLQDSHEGKDVKKYSFIIHTEQRKECHKLQESIIGKMKDLLREEAAINSELFNSLINNAYTGLSSSIKTQGSFLPPIEDVKNDVIAALQEDHLMIAKVNSEKDVKELLDDKGQLKLRNPFNLFIGGQILDRGITISNLIGFYYGRNPRIYQQDTVMQHSRMYGNRPKDDLAVTRFYATVETYNVMRQFHESNTALREAFERRAHNKGVIFIHMDNNGSIVPCSPNKVLLSSVTTLKPHKRLLPVGFQTLDKSEIAEHLRTLDSSILPSRPRNSKTPFLLELSVVKQIINVIGRTLKFSDGYDWNLKAFLASLEYFSLNSIDEDLRGKVWVIVRTNRNISRTDLTGRFEDSPDTPKGRNGETKVAREIAINIPALILLRQNGREELGWRGSPFWWPVLIVPENTSTVMFAGDLAK